jgi:predicted nucleic acid-binding protein
VKIAFDTSVLVAGLIKSHPEFERASLWLDALDPGVVTGLWTSHAYAETWSVLTRLPLVERLSPDEVTNIVDSLAAVCPPTDLLTRDYRAAARRSSDAEARSGVIFDALHLVAAERANVDALLTLNPRDFLRLSPAIRVLEPPGALALPVG